MYEMTEQPNSKKALNTLIAIICITIVALVGVYAIGEYVLDGEAMKFIITIAIVAVAGLGGYEIREQMRQS